MTQLSLRYVRPLSACLLLALVPVVVHSYIRVDIDDCKVPGSLVPESAQASDSGGGRGAWMREQFQSSQWHEGSFYREGLRFDFSIIRSYDAKRLYYRPEYALVQPHIVNSLGIEWVRTDSGGLPIHRAYYGGTDASILVAYLLVYRSFAVANPYWAQLRAAPAELFSGRRPMTLFLIQAHGSPGSLGEVEKVEREWLLSSWERYRSACTY